jgi:hypothetical protein
LTHSIPLNVPPFSITHRCSLREDRVCSERIDT